jgi:LmbE family N-acetylglucosaminyl deacetylase
MTWYGRPLLGRRLIVVAPHPDDEVLAAGGLMRWSARQDREVVVVAVTDGEASHARSTLVTPAALRQRRAAERDDALGRLGLDEVTVHRLGEPDQGCGERVAAIADAIRSLVAPGDVVIAPSRGDRHPDHVAACRASRRAARHVVDEIWEAPTWALVHGTAGAPSTAFELDAEAWVAKCDAVAAYRSQLEPLGPSLADGPVVHPHELTVLLTRCERFRAVRTGP